MTPRMAAGGLVDLKLGHYSKDGIEVVNVEGEIDIYTAPRLRGLLIDLAGRNSCQLIVNLDKVGILDSTGLGCDRGPERVRPHDGSLDLVCTQERIRKSSRSPGPRGLRHLGESRPRRRSGEEVTQGPAWFALALRPRVTARAVTSPSTPPMPCPTRRAGRGSPPASPLLVEHPQLSLHRGDALPLRGDAAGEQVQLRRGQGAGVRQALQRRHGRRQDGLAEPGHARHPLRNPAQLNGPQLDQAGEPWPRCSADQSSGLVLSQGVAAPLVTVIVPARGCGNAPARPRGGGVQAQEDALTSGRPDVA